ncbi:NAD(P)/FAD-dependent oxidoreductase [Actinotalea sp. K2]|uniref:NAD(P)/FAD-dependent oxidoreductase n=1 Tax=Actinotalea sp. K2 TaxID=2939438 RepID=UPI0020170075|nr:FAD/NAD(P)-binding oxidoreductase [Actinotalea sp. K2]MCL3859780.1 NAD(P)/FAD-dependent oxidoreductase [Actinotalea sp. K2]
MTTAPHHDVLIIGGGNAGISLAARLRRDGCRDVAVVEPEQTHHYRPLLSYVAGGMATLDDLRRPEASVIPPGCAWYADHVTAVEPERFMVRLAGGGEITYGDLVVCPGSQVDWDAVPGSREAVATPDASTSYLPHLAEKTWAMLSSLREGTVVLAVSDRHVPCAPVALKPLLMAADHWRQEGTLDRIAIELLVEGDRLVDHDRGDRELRAAAAGYGIRVRTGTAVESVDPLARELRVRTPADPDLVRYDALLLAPPHRAPGWVSASGLSGPQADGFVAVDPHTLAHLTHPRVWGLGDAAAVDALPSGGALRKQVPVVAHNIAARRTGGPMRRYDGYSIAPVTTSRRDLLLAELDRDGRPEPTVPFPDLARPRRNTFLFDRFLEPHVYWRWLLTGHVS